jgi:hypothetical protein
MNTNANAQHGSDSGTYDPEGRFIPQLFENLFAKWDKDNDGALTLRELFSMMKGHRCAADPFGVSALPQNSHNPTNEHNFVVGRSFF